MSELDLIDLRDDFAIAALEALIHARPGPYTADELAESSYRIADAMMKAREAK